MDLIKRKKKKKKSKISKEEEEKKAGKVDYSLSSSSVSDGGGGEGGSGGGGDGNSGGYMTDSFPNLDRSEVIQVVMKKKRIFRPKESILTVLSRDDKNFKSLYHAFIIMIITGIAYSLLKDTVEAGKPYVDVAYYNHGFGPAQDQITAIIVWIPLQITALLVYPAFRIWSAVHPSLGLPVDVVSLLFFIAYNIAGHALVVTSIVNFNIPPVPALVLSIEELRFTLKSISFVRENAYKVLYPWHKDDQSGPAIWYAGQMSPKVGSFSQYVYFLFAPTLLYRDNYPRIPRVNFLRVIAHLIKCIISVTFISIVTKEIFTGTYDGSGKKFAETFLSCMLWGLILHFMAGYFFLHSWHNLFGEMLRFADREFYSDWWTCTAFSQYYRKWNLLVHDWIKAYIYRDLKDLFNSRLYNKVAVFPTILISAIYHEYVFWAPMRYVMPILLVQFGLFGALLFFLRPSPDNSGWNYFLHFSLHVGVSIMVFAYTMEFFARKICPKEENLVNTFIPRFYECFVA